jgi:hypothetical protein
MEGYSVSSMVVFKRIKGKGNEELRCLRRPLVLLEVL